MRHDIWKGMVADAAAALSDVVRKNEELTLAACAAEELIACLTG